VFERFTDRARRVMVLAQAHAQALQHNYIGTEHLLLGMLEEAEGIAGRALAAHGITMADTMLRLESGTTASSGHIPYTPRAKKVLELALREALQLGHNYIGTEHVLLGLLRDGGGKGAELVGNSAGLRSHVLALLGQQLEAAKKKLLHITGLREPDEQWLKMRAILDACKAAGVDTPIAVHNYLAGSETDGPVVDLQPLATDWKNGSATGLELDLAKLPDGVTKLRFYLS
jgi:ATP-dependent Clp protease ATP-binding subunit ClpA